MSLQKIPLSNGPYGAPIAVTNTTITTGTLIHQSSANNGVGQGDEVVLYAANIDATTSHTLTLSVGANNASNTANVNLQRFVISNNSTVQVMSGLMIANTLGVWASVDTANTINITGYVIRSS